MNDAARVWKILCGHPRVATREYSFGPGTANAIAIESNGVVVIVSAPIGPGAAAAMDEAASWGEVRALVAPNAFHNMGVAPWKQRFPQARVFAPAQSLARVAQKSGVAGVEPLGNAAGILGGELELVDIPHYKTGEALVRVRTAEGTIWSLADAVFNLPVLPPNPVAKLVFWASGSAPGLRVNRIAPLFMVRDRKAQRGWLRQQAEKDVPRWFIPGHGDIVDLAGTPARLPALFAA
jgi:hypothetical protein